MPNQSPDELVEASVGNINAKNLTKDSGLVFTYLYDGPLIEHLEDNEQPEYIFSNETKGYRITEPDGNERTPHHNSSEGKRYLLITNYRLLYVAGCKNGDESIEHVYDEVAEVENVEISNIQFRTTDGNTYKFAQNGAARQTVDAAINYISKRAAGNGKDKTDEERDKSVVEVEPDSSEHEDETNKTDEERDKSVVEVEPDSSEHEDETISAALSVYPEVEGNGWEELPTRFLKPGGSKKHTKILGTSYLEFRLDFRYKTPVSADDKCLTINNIKIDYSDIKNARLLKDKKLVSAFRSYDIARGCDYIALTIDRKVLSNKNEEKNKAGVFYLYLIGNVESIRKHHTVRTDDKKLKMNDEISTSREQLESFFGEIESKNPYDGTEKYVLHDKIELPSCLKVEGWKESGATTVEAGIEGETESKSDSSGYQIGPYTSSKSNSEGTITAQLDGSISDNSFTSKIKFIQVTEDGLFIDSDPTLDFNFGSINRIMKRSKGFTIDAEGTKYSIFGYLGRNSSPNSLDSPVLDEAIEYMQKRIEETSGTTTDNSRSEHSASNRLRELKSLHEDGILTDEEFKNKKEELLQDF